MMRGGAYSHVKEYTLQPFPSFTSGASLRVPVERDTMQASTHVKIDISNGNENVSNGNSMWKAQLFTAAVFGSAVLSIIVNYVVCSLV